MKISILCSDLSGNSFGRAYLLASILKRRYEIEIVGFSLFRQGREIWGPCDTNEFDVKALRGSSGLGTYLSAIKNIEGRITGDVLYAMKPRMSSFGIALLKKLSNNLPLVLDNDDWEVGFTLTNTKIKVQYLVNVWDINSFWYLKVMEKLIPFADQVTTSSTFLQRKFGGVIVPHGRDTSSFDPKRFDRFKIRYQWKIGDDEDVLMFLGSPVVYKGLEDLVNAVNILNRDNIRLFIVGMDFNYKYVKRLMKIAGSHVTFIGQQPFQEIPKFISMADVIVIPQSNNPACRGQMPAKLYDAMAMAKPIIASKISDIPNVLKGCGYLFEPGDVKGLVEKINYVLDNKEEAIEKGKLAREKCIKNYSWDAIEKVLIKVFARYEN
nr:glycosyltransferase [Desulfobacterales bacterium]